MTTYQKIAVVILRLVGMLWAFTVSLMWALYFIELASGVDVPRYPTHTLIGNAGYILLGLGVAAAAKPLGRFIGRGLDA